MKEYMELAIYNSFMDELYRVAGDTPRVLIRRYNDSDLCAPNGDDIGRTFYDAAGLLEQLNRYHLPREVVKTLDYSASCGLDLDFSLDDEGRPCIAMNGDYFRLDCYGNVTAYTPRDAAAEIVGEVQRQLDNAAYSNCDLIAGLYDVAPVIFSGTNDSKSPFGSSPLSRAYNTLYEIENSDDDDDTDDDE